MHPLEHSCPRATILRMVPRLSESSFIFFKHNEIFSYDEHISNLHKHIYLKTFVLGTNYNVKSFKKGPETLRSLLYVHQTQ